MILVIGEILFDEFPGYRRVGGAPYNYAVHLRNLGFNVRFFSRVGSDEYGEEIRDIVKQQGLLESDIQVDPEHPTGRVIVKPDNHGGHTFDIIRDTAYDYISFDEIESAVDMKGCKLIYTGTLIQRTGRGFRNIQGLLNSKENSSRIFYDINLRPGCYTRGVVDETLRISDVLKMNSDELQELTQMFHLTGNREERVAGLSGIYNIPLVVVTDSQREVLVYDKGSRYRGTPPGVKDLKDSVGAGDAFSAALTAGILEERNTETVLEAALSLSSYICTVKGAVPDDKSAYMKTGKILAGG